MTSRSDVALLTADLTAAGFSSERLRETWGRAADDAIGRGLRAPALRALNDRRDALAVLGRLLIFGVSQSRADVDAALPTLGVSGLVSLGLAATDADTVRATAVVRPQSFEDDRGSGEWWIASDLDELATGGTLPPDHVLGVGGASLTLAGLQLASPAARVLDLGTGCGVQALRARRYASEVVATDVSGRALRFAELNAVLNGVDAIELRHGSMFDPVAGERFDRIVSNPPFVITPRGDSIPEYEYRDAGLVGDAVVERLVRAVGDHLTPGGVAQFLGNWETRDGVDGLARFRGWVEESDIPLDAWIVERERLEPVEYAETWIRDGGTRPGTPEHDALLGAWLDDFEARGVTAIGFGYVLLRRAEERPTLRRFESVPQPLPAESAIGAHLDAVLAAHDRIAGLDDDALAHEHLRVASDVIEARHHMPGADQPRVIELRQGSGFGRAVPVDPGLAGLVGACDGELSLGSICSALAHLLDADPAALRTELLAAVRELVLDGFLVPADREA